MSILVYVVDGRKGKVRLDSQANIVGLNLRRAYGPTGLDDAAYLKAFHPILSSPAKSANDFCSALDRAIGMKWEDVYDIVNPFGNRRGVMFGSVWTLDFEKDILFLTTADSTSAASLEIGRQRLLTEADLEPVVPTHQTHHEDTLPGPYWEPKLSPRSREAAFLERVLTDFFDTWRHIIRRSMRPTTFMKLAYAIIWILTMNFSLQERIGFEHNTEKRGAYVGISDLPGWDTPDEKVVAHGSCYIVISRDIREGLEKVRCDAEKEVHDNDEGSRGRTYAIMTPALISLCQASTDGLEYTKAEALFDTASLSEAAIMMILWMSTLFFPQHRRTRIDSLPVGIQDRILRFASDSLVAAAKLGCELSLGSPFSWIDSGVPIGIKEFKRHQSEMSPVESLLIIRDARSGLSYQRRVAFNGRMRPYAVGWGSR